MRPSLEELSKVLALIHEAAASPERWTQALAALTQLCESSKGALLDVDGSGRFVGLTQTGHDPAAQKEYVEHYHAVDPTLQVAVSGRPHEALVTYERFAAAVRVRHEYFAYMARYDVGDVIGMTTRGGPTGRSLLSLQRPLRAPGFGDDAKRLFRLIAPHLEIAKQVQARVAAAVAERNALAADARARPRGGKLTFAATRLQSAFEAAVRPAASRKLRSQTLPLPADLAAAAAEIVVCPLCEMHPLAGPWQQPLVLVMIGLPRNDATAIAARMRTLYRLTPAEARLAAGLALGASVEEISTRTGVRQSTLRTQISSIFAKAGVARQAELVQVALSGAALAPEPQ